VHSHCHYAIHTRAPHGIDPASVEQRHPEQDTFVDPGVLS
jgi:hypothetical protein